MADKLAPGKSLGPGKSLVSKNGLFWLIMQRDGNLVLYKYLPGRDAVHLWASDTMNQANLALMDPDGCLRVVHHVGGKTWAEFPPPKPVVTTAGKMTVVTACVPGSYLIVQDDGNAVIYAGKGKDIWATNTVTRDQSKLVIPGALSVNIRGDIDGGNTDKTIVNDTGKLARVLAADSQVTIRPGKSIGAQSTEGNLAVTMTLHPWSSFRDGGDQDKGGDARAVDRVYRRGENTILLSLSKQGSPLLLTP